MDLERDHSIAEVAEALQMSERWVRQRVKDGAEHMRYGHKIRMTAKQVDLLRGEFRVAPVTEPRITTGPRRRRP